MNFDILKLNDGATCQVIYELDKQNTELEINGVFKDTENVSGASKYIPRSFKYVIIFSRFKNYIKLFPALLILIILINAIAVAIPIAIFPSVYPMKKEKLSFWKSVQSFRKTFQWYFISMMIVVLLWSVSLLLTPFLTETSAINFPLDCVPREILPASKLTNLEQ